LTTTESDKNDKYLLGVNQLELERLQFQHTVWGSVTKKFLQRLNVRQGWQCLDVGAGPGLVSMDLRELVGATGDITALEPSQFYLDSLRQQADSRGWTNIHCVKGTAEDAAFPSCSFDLIFVRWVIAFVPDPEQFLAPLFRALRPGGVIAIQDYYYEGLSLFPRGGIWDTMPDIVRAYYRSGGGDTYVTGKIPAIFRKHGIEIVDFSPTCLSGGPTSGVMEWAQRFFSLHIPLMAEKGIISQAQADELMADWNAHRKNPDALFFSPLVVDVAGRAHL
jgi:SAM-dependent methyltransferase